MCMPSYGTGGRERLAMKAGHVPFHTLARRHFPGPQPSRKEIAMLHSQAVAWWLHRSCYGDEDSLEVVWLKTVPRSSRSCYCCTYELQVAFPLVLINIILSVMPHETHTIRLQYLTIVDNKPKDFQEFWYNVALNPSHQSYSLKKYQNAETSGALVSYILQHWVSTKIIFSL